VADTRNRKKTAAYYTPPSLVDCLLDSALDPVLAKFAQQPSPPGDPAAAILGKGDYFSAGRRLALVDPSCGAAVFLVRAARRIARRVAQLRCWTNGEPSEDVYRAALWQVVDKCVHGVDLSPYAVELSKVVLWMDSAREGAALQFLDPNIQHGNSLLGATPKLLAEGIPDEAWDPITGDDPAVARELKARNRKERRAWEKAQKEAKDVVR
jgi:hypothetical protein